jgi:hypothetical protein
MSSKPEHIELVNVVILIMTEVIILNYILFLMALKLVRMG